MPKNKIAGKDIGARIPEGWHKKNRAKAKGLALFKWEAMKTVMKK
jgi:hypothetical protein